MVKCKFFYIRLTFAMSKPSFIAFLHQISMLISVVTMLINGSFRKVLNFWVKNTYFFLIYGEKATRLSLSVKIKQLYCSDNNLRLYFVPKKNND